VKQRLEEARAGSFVFPLTVFLSPKGADDFLRARELTIRKAGKPLTEGQTFEAVVDDYLDRHDEVRRAARLAAEERSRLPADGEGSRGCAAKSAGRKSGAPRSRHVLARSLRALLGRAGDCCWVEGCDRRAFLQICHLRAFARGGSNGARNLVRLCREHHVQMDSGVWWPKAKRDGSIVMIVRRGVVVGRFRGGPRPAAEPASAEEGTARPPP
jgi:hypothetical protein